MRSSTKPAGAIAELRARLKQLHSGQDDSTIRYRRILLTTAASSIARIGSMAVNILSVRIVIPYLGPERYGLWMTLTSVLAWGILADVGVTRGLSNLLSEADGKKDENAFEGLTTAAFVALSGSALIGALLLWSVFNSDLVSYSALGIPATLHGEASSSLGVLGAFFLLSLPTSVFATALAALQRGYVVQLLSLPSALAGLAATYLASRTGAGMATIVGIGSAAQVVPQLLAVPFLLRDHPRALPRPKAFRMRYVGLLASLSVAAFAFQIGALLVNQTQTVMLGRLIDLKTAGEYSLVMRVYLLAAQFLLFVDAPFMPALRSALASGDVAWSRTALWRLAAIKSVTAALAGVLLGLLGNLAADFLSRGTIRLPNSVWWAAGGLLLVSMWVATFSSYMLAVDRIWSQVALALLNGVATVGLTFALGPRLGVLGALLALGAFSLFVNSWLLPLLVVRHLRALAPATRPASTIGLA